MRAQIDPWIVSAIPNAVDAEMFQPPNAAESLAKSREFVTIVVVSRLVSQE